MCRIHEDGCEMLSRGMCECTRLSVPPPPLRLPKDGFVNVRFWDSRHGEGLISKRLVPVKVSEKNVTVPIISASLGMPPSYSVLAHTYVLQEKHRITVLSVTSAKGCTLLGRSGLHKKTTFAMCFHHLNPNRHICFPRNFFFEDSRR